MSSVNDWSHGYVADVAYTYGYYPELNPARVNLSFLCGGLVPPQIESACELGFGQGLSLNLHAAGSELQWWGTDFNPAHVAQAQELVKASGAHCRVVDDAFADFANRSDLPDFDFVAFHGVWSWVSEDNRRVLVDFLRRKLRPGGVAYISYNTLPGWSPMLGLRELMIEAADRSPAGSDSRSRVMAGVRHLAPLFDEEALSRFVAHHPGTSSRFKRFEKQNPAYLAHEYFNRDWAPMTFAQMNRWMGSAKLDFAVPALGLEALDALQILPKQRQWLDSLQDPVLRQMSRDFLVNQGFRRDYWVKGPRNLPSGAIAERLREQWVVLVTPRDVIEMQLKGAVATMELDAATYGWLLDALSDHRPRALAELMDAPQARGFTVRRWVQVLSLMLAGGHLAPATPEPARAREQAQRLNRTLCERARHGTDIHYLASPVTGGGLQVNRIEQMFLHLLQQGCSDPAQWADQVVAILYGAGERLVHEGKTLKEPAEGRAQLLEQAQRFAAKRLPMLRALGVC